VPGPYSYLGLSTLGYPDFADLETGRMLVAEPGGSYGIRAIDGVAPVPPGDGRWGQAASSDGPPSVPALIPPPRVPALAEGGE
jgi:hypothetical protein